MLCCYQASAQTAASGTDSRLLHVESKMHWTSNLTQARDALGRAQKAATEAQPRREDSGDKSTARSTDCGDKSTAREAQTAVRRAQPRESTRARSER